MRTSREGNGWRSLSWTPIFCSAILVQDHEVLGPKAIALVVRIEHGELEPTSDSVLFETVFTLERYYRQPRTGIVRNLLPLIGLPTMNLPGKRIYRRVFELYLDTPLGFADCYHVALMERLDTREILSFDTDFDRIPGIIRREE